MDSLNLELANAVNESKSLKAVRDLVEAGADVNAVGEYGRTVLYAVQDNPTGLQIFLYLISKGADVNARDPEDITPLHMYCRCHDDAWVIKAALDYGADVNARTTWGMTPLHFVVDRDWDNTDKAYGMALVLISYGADVNATEKRAWSPLHYAIQGTDFEKTIRTLLLHGAAIKAPMEEIDD